MGLLKTLLTFLRGLITKTARGDLAEVVTGTLSTPAVRGIGRYAPESISLRAMDLPGLSEIPGLEKFTNFIMA
jgi:hypothetical protein